MTIRPFVIVLHARNHKGKVIVMTETLDRATILRNQAVASKKRTTHRVTAVAKRLCVAEFLNSNAQYVDHLEDTLFRAPKPTTAHVAALRSIIREDKLDELVWPAMDEVSGVYLSRLIAPIEDAS